MINIDELKEHCKKLINAHYEGAKVELKSKIDIKSKRDIAELTKLLSALANTDTSIFQNIGYIILGVERGRIVGGMDFLKKDSSTADLQNSINNYIKSPIEFEICYFDESIVGTWGVVIIPESIRQPHFIAKEYTDEKGTVFRKNECYVRHGDRIELAGPEDFNRMYSKKNEKNEKRLAFLEEKLLGKEINSEPKLFLTFIDVENNPIGKEGNIQITYPPKTQIDKIKDYINKATIHLQSKYTPPKGPSTIYSQFAEAFTSKIDIKKYKDALREYYLDTVDKILLSYRCIKINIAIENQGDVAGNTLLIFVDFPLCRVHINEDFLKFKMKPETSKMLYPITRTLMKQEIPKDIIKQDIKIKQTDKKAIVSFELEKLLHGIRYTFSSLYVMVPNNQSSIEISYNIHAENLAKPIKDKLLLYIDINEKSSDTLNELAISLQRDMQKY